MNIRSLFRVQRSSRRFQARKSAASRTPARLATEQLESRAMLAGNVTAQLIGQSVFLNGDSADNTAAVSVENGNVVVRGTDGTTINGSADDFVIATNSTNVAGSIVARLGDGNDNFAVNGVSVGRNVRINGGRGSDQLVLTDATVGRNAAISGWSGDDVLVVSSSNVGRHLRISGGSGNDDVVVDDSEIGRDLRVVGWRGDDDIAIRNSSIGDDAVIVGHSGDDVIMIDTSSIADRSRIHAGQGTDNVVVQGASTFGDRARIIGGHGSDNLEIAAEATFNKSRRRRFSGSTADATAVEARITNATTGAFALAEAAIDVFDPTLTLTLSQSNFAETAGVVSDGLTVTRSGDTTSELVINLTATNTDRITLPATVTIPAGETTVTADVTVIDNNQSDGDAVVTITGSTADIDSSSVDVTIEDDDTLTLTAASSSVVEQSNGVEITKDDTFTITGTTAPGATITVDRDGDGAFDDGTTTADATGNYTVDTTLLNNSSNRGANDLVIRSTSGSETSDQNMAVHLAVGSVVRFQTNQDFDGDGNLDSYDIEMLDADAPVTVDNFLQYVNDDAFTDNFVHRIATPQNAGISVIQGGGFNVTDDTVTGVNTRPAIPDEFDPPNSNLRGTLSMANAGRGTGTSQWFVNVTDNVALDLSTTNPDGDTSAHPVFGRVIGDGMDVVDAVFALDLENLIAETGNGALANVPVTSPTEAQLTGTVSTTAGSAIVSGVGTIFSTELAIGDSINIQGSIFEVAGIASDTELSVQQVVNQTQTSVTYTRFELDSTLVVFSDVSELLSSL